MAAKIDGLVIEIGANTSSFKQSMRDVQNEAKGISKDLKTVSESLKLDPENVGKAADKLKLLKDQAENATKKVEVIKKAIEALNKEYDDKSSKEYTDQLHKLEAQLESATREQELANQKVKQFSQNAGEAGKSAFSLGDAIKGNLISSAIKSGLQTIVDLAKKLAHHLVEAVKSIAKGSWDWANAGANLIETENKVDAVFKGSSDNVKEWAKDAAHNVRVSKQVAMEHAASFGNIFTNMGMATDKAADYSTQLMEVAAAQADFNNMSTEEVLDKIDSALTGNYQGLKALGIVMNEDKVIEKALAMTHKQNKDELTDLEKTMARVELMFDGSINAVEKFKENSGSLVSLIAELKSKFSEIRDEVGSKFTPVYENLLQKVSDFINSDEGQQVIEAIIEQAEYLANKITNWIAEGKLDEWIESLKEKIPDLIHLANEFVVKIGEMIPKVMELTDEILALFGIKSENQKIKEAFLEVEGQIKQFAQSSGTDIDTMIKAIHAYAEANDVDLLDIYNNWNEYQPKISVYIGQITTDANGAKTDLDIALQGMTSSTQTNIESQISTWDRLKQKVQEIMNFFDGPAGHALRYFLNPAEMGKDLLTGNLGLGNLRASGGPAAAGHIYQVNDDAARRKELFIPYTNGYILNGNDTERIVNNNTNNSRTYGDTNIYITSTGTNAAAIADEIGAAVNQRRRMAGTW